MASRKGRRGRAHENRTRSIAWFARREGHGWIGVVTVDGKEYYWTDLLDKRTARKFASEKADSLRSAHQARQGAY